MVTIGNFDGVHLGHRTLIDRARELAGDGLVCAFTFDPAPVDVLRPQQQVIRIQTLADRTNTLVNAGVDHVVIEPFSKEYAAHEPEWFAKEVLTHRLRASAVVVGWDFRFGKGRQGTTDALRTLLDVPVVQMSGHELVGGVVSSSRIRQAVQAGDVRVATRLLGRPHDIVGTVETGDQRGRTLGWPTANVSPDTPLVPANGVYAVRVSRDGVQHVGVANIGQRPTFDGLGVRVEVHLFDFDGDLYGEKLRVGFIERIRGEQRFGSAEELVARIQQDAAQAKTILDPS